MASLTAILILPISGTVTSTAAAVEALAELEHATAMLSAAAVAAGSVDANSAAGGGDVMKLPPTSTVVAECEVARGALGRADTAVTLMHFQLVSVRERTCTAHWPRAPRPRNPQPSESPPPHTQALRLSKPLNPRLP